MTEPSEILDAMKVAVGALETLEPAERHEAVRSIASLLGAASALSYSEMTRSDTVTGVVGDDTEEVEAAPTPKSFLAAKRPTTDVLRYACLAYYLSCYRDQGTFKTKDITELAIEAAQPKFSNASQAGKNATKDLLLASASGGKRQITDLGERVVEALPDDDAVKAIRAKTPKRRRRTQQRKAAKKS